MSDSTFRLKGRLEVGDKVSIAQQVPDGIRRLLRDLEGGTVLAINGDMVSIRAQDGSEVLEIHRKYFCSMMLVGHAGSPCPICGYISEE